MSIQSPSPKRFTEQMITRISSPCDAKRMEISDAIIPGLVLRVTPKGTKSFSVIYRVPSEGGVNGNGKLLVGKQHRITLGRWPIVSLKEAREQAREILSTVTEGKDPRCLLREQNQLRHSNTFKSVLERYIELYARSNLATWKSVQGTLRKHVIPLWADRPIQDITRAEIHELLDTLVQAKKIGAARETWKHLRALFNWAVEREIIPASPANNLKRKELAYPDDHGRVLEDHELRAVWAGAESMGYAYGALFQLLILTGQRTSDWAKAQWGEVNTDKKLLEIPAPRYKTRREHAVPLSEPVLEILETLPRWTKGNYLFCARGSSGSLPASGFSKTSPRLKRLSQQAYCEQLKDENAELEHFTIKDLRKTCRTRLTHLGVSEEIAEVVIGHTQAKIVRTYNRYAYVEEKREALECYGQHIMEILHG